MRHTVINDMCHLVVLDEERSIVFGSPSEWIKECSGVPFPRHVVLGKKIHERGCNLSEIEFPVYKNFFFNRMRKTVIVAPGVNIPDLRSSLQETLLGPLAMKRDYCGEKASFFIEALAVRKNFDPSGPKLILDDFVEFLPLPAEGCDVDGVHVRPVGEMSFLIRHGGGELLIDLKGPGPAPAAVEKKSIDGALSIFCFDSGDGFSPGKGCSSFLLNAGGDYVLFDPNMRVYDDISRYGIDPGRIRAIFISHVHADHDQGLYRFLAEGTDVPVVAADIVLPSLLVKVRAGTGERDPEKKWRFISVPVRERTVVDFLDGSLYCDVGFHTIPSVMTKFYFNQTNLRDSVFAYSGDTLYDRGRFGAEGFPGDYRRDLEGFLDDARVIVHEAGAGLIHTDPEDLIPFLGEHQRVFWMHTARDDSGGFSRGSILKKGRTEIVL